jgi:hypothetical protein
MSRGSARAAVRLLTAAGIALLGAGMAFVVGGVIARGLFMPGVYVLVLGFAVLLAAGVFVAVGGAPPAESEAAAEAPARAAGAGRA